MRIRSFIRVCCAVFIGALMLSILPELAWKSSYEPSQEHSIDVILKPPAFVQQANAQGNDQESIGGDFLQREAGMSAHANANTSIELERVRGLFRTVDVENEQFIMGPVVPPGYSDFPELEDVADIHVFVDRSGWIVAFLLVSESSGRIIDWLSYEQTGVLSTTLENTIRRFMQSANVTDVPIGYYDFRYPEATTLALIADAEPGNQQTDQFQIKIPDSFEVYERAISGGTRNYAGGCELNSSRMLEMSNGNGWLVKYVSLSPSEFPVNRTNAVGTASYGCCTDVPVYCGIVLTLRETK